MITLALGILSVVLIHCIVWHKIRTGIIMYITPIVTIACIVSAFV